MLALSAISLTAISAALAAASVSPPKDCKSEALNDVTCCIYSLAEIPAVVYALFALVITFCADSPNSVSIPPIDCCNAPYESDTCFTSPTPAVAIAPVPSNKPLPKVFATPPILDNFEADFSPVSLKAFSSFSALSIPSRLILPII